MHTISHTYSKIHSIYTVKISRFRDGVLTNLKNTPKLTSRDGRTGACIGEGVVVVGGGGYNPDQNQ